MDFAPRDKYICQAIHNLLPDVEYVVRNGGYGFTFDTCHARDFEACAEAIFSIAKGLTTIYEKTGGTSYDATQN